MAPAPPRNPARLSFAFGGLSRTDRAARLDEDRSPWVVGAVDVIAEAVDAIATDQLTERD